MNTKGKFKLAPDLRKSQQQADLTGTVIVKIFLASEGHQATRGNIVRTVRLDRAKVSRVHKEFMSLIKRESDA